MLYGIRLRDDVGASQPLACLFLWRRHSKDSKIKKKKVKGKMNSGLQRGTGTEGFSFLGVQDLKSMYYYIMAWYVAWSIHSGIL